MDSFTDSSTTSEDPQAEVLSVSVVIPAYSTERWPLLKRAVESVRVQSNPVETIVVCIDNNPELLEMATSEWQGAEAPRIHVLANRRSDHLTRVGVHQRAHGTQRRFGAGSVRNTGAEGLGTDVIAFMDDDAWADPDWVSQLLKVYRDHPVVAVGGASLPEYASRRPDWFPVNFDWIFGCSYDGLPTETAPLRHLIGANMSVRRDAFEAVGGFKGSDFDDLNLCMRLLERYGVASVYYTPMAIVHHYVSAERVSWQYFWRRCYFVNREKVRVFATIGSAANLSAERAFAVRALTRTTRRALRRALGGDRAALRSLGAMWIGLFLAGVGNLSGRLDQLRRSHDRDSALAAS
jgi:GT2 family glycosyltransferase